MAMDSATKLQPAPTFSHNIQVHETYISRIQSLLAKLPHIKWSLESKGSHLTKVAYTNTLENYRVTSPEDLIAQSADLKESHERSICIIENISTEYVEALGTEWGIDPMFFIEHATNPDKDTLWWTKEWDWSPPDPSSSEGRDESHVSKDLLASRAPSFLKDSSGHLDGVFEYHNEIPGLEPSAFGKLNSSPNFIYRHCFKDKNWPMQSNTRISYCRPNMWMYLFLVDAPIKFPSNILETHSRSLPTLRFMNSTSRGGVEMPKLYHVSQNQYSVFENLKIFCQHSWHLRVLFDTREHSKGHYEIDGSQDVLPCHPLIYLLVSCLWEENLRYLDKEIKRISFRELRNPKLEINSELHDRREDLARIKKGLIETAMYIPAEVKEYFATHPQWSTSSRIRIENLKRLIEEATKLEAFLMETFQLFMSSLSVQDSRLSINQSRLSIDQAQRGTRLTILAFIYVPLSFVTAIFGMNIQQINGSGLNIWVCFVALVAVLFVTALVFLAVKLYGNRKDARKKLAYYPEV